MSVATSTLPFADGSVALDTDVRQVVDLYYTALWRFLRRMGVDEGHVEDALQNVLIVYAQRSTEIAPHVVRSFLFGTALRVASDHRRRLARTVDVARFADLTDQEHPAADAERALEQRELRRLLDRILDELTPEHRAVFVLAELEEMTMAEIAAVLCIPSGTVASRLRRARDVVASKAMALKQRVDKAPAR